MVSMQDEVYLYVPVTIPRLDRNDEDDSFGNKCLGTRVYPTKTPKHRPNNTITCPVIQNGKSSSSTLVHVRYPKPPPSLPMSNSRQFLIKGLTISRAIALISSIFFSNFFSVSL